MAGRALRAKLCQSPTTIVQKPGISDSTCTAAVIGPAIALQESSSSSWLSRSAGSGIDVPEHGLQLHRSGFHRRQIGACLTAIIGEVAASALRCGVLAAATTSTCRMGSASVNSVPWLVNLHVGRRETLFAAFGEAPLCDDRQSPPASSAQSLLSAFEDGELPFFRAVPV